MLDASRLRALGLGVVEGPAGVEAELSLQKVRLVNPLTRRPVEKVRFAVAGERVRAVAPAEFVGFAPFPVLSAADLEEELGRAFSESMAQLQRRSSELMTLGLSPLVDPASLRLAAELSFGSFRCWVGADRGGHFSVLRVEREGQVAPLPAAPGFELSEFRDRGALVAYLAALVGAVGEGEPKAHGAVLEVEQQQLLLDELAVRFGVGVRIPPQSPVELLVELEIQGLRYRFAATRVLGRTFRGLLAGPRGKVWAGRFEIERFPGVAMLAAQLLGFPVEQVRIIHGEGVHG